MGILLSSLHHNIVQQFLNGYSMGRWNHLLLDYCFDCLLVLSSIRVVIFAFYKSLSVIVLKFVCLSWVCFQG